MVGLYIISVFLDSVLKGIAQFLKWEKNTKINLEREIFKEMWMDLNLEDNFNGCVLLER
jgi:hypothetical protein